MPKSHELVQFYYDQFIPHRWYTKEYKFVHHLKEKPHIQRKPICRIDIKICIMTKSFLIVLPSLKLVLLTANKIYRLPHIFLELCLSDEQRPPLTRPITVAGSMIMLQDLQSPVNMKYTKCTQVGGPLFSTGRVESSLVIVGIVYRENPCVTTYEPKNKLTRQTGKILRRRHQDFYCAQFVNET